MGRVEGKVVFITGAARGQGRSHALRLAAEGADIIAIDICEDVPIVGAPLGSDEDLAETVRQVEALDRRIVARRVDVRDREGLRAAVDEGVAALGRLDAVVANAAIDTMQRWDETTDEIWQTTIDINLTGVWNTCAVSAPHLIDGGGGSMVLISSAAGLKGMPFQLPYATAKHGVVGLMRTLANELGPHSVRVNSVHPTGVDTPMVEGLAEKMDWYANDPNLGAIAMNTLPVEMLDPIEISHAVLFLASDESRYVTGLRMTVDAGMTAR